MHCLGRSKRLISLYRLSSRASNFIEWLVAQTLHTDEIKGLDLLVDLARSPDIDRLDIITLNHDTLVEQLLGEHDIPFVDGFGTADGDIRFFDEQLFDNPTSKVRILKPHGSVNWYRVRGEPYPDIFCVESLENCRREDGEKQFIDIRTPAFLWALERSCLTIAAYSQRFSIEFIKYSENTGRW